jgi:hypothetical protein
MDPILEKDNVDTWSIRLYVRQLAFEWRLLNLPNAPVFALRIAPTAFLYCVAPKRPSKTLPSSVGRVNDLEFAIRDRLALEAFLELEEGICDCSLFGAGIEANSRVFLGYFREGSF